MLTPPPLTTKSKGIKSIGEVDKHYRSNKRLITNQIIMIVHNNSKSKIDNKTWWAASRRPLQIRPLKS